MLEDHLGVCGYVLATLDSKIFYDGYHSNWLMQLEGKYPPHSPVAMEMAQRLYVVENHT